MNVFEISNCVELEEVIIGACSFNSHLEEPKQEKWTNENGIFRITDCLKLKKISVGVKSFENYYGSFELKSNY